MTAVVAVDVAELAATVNDGAICGQVDLDLFFPEKGGSLEPAKTICRNCPIRAECLELALARNERYGVWGGTSERERRRLKGWPTSGGRAES